MLREPVRGLHVGHVRAGRGSGPPQQADADAEAGRALEAWHTNKGFAATTVTDICKAAAVSKALFYVYFSRREDVLLEVEVFAMRDAHQAARALASRPYELPDLITALIETLEHQMRKYPPEVVFEAVMESHRLEARALAEGTAQTSFLFQEPFEQARRDGKLPPGADVARAAYIAQVLMADGMRSWAAREFASPSPSQTLGQEISALLNGTWAGTPRAG